MSATPDNTLADPEQFIADLQRQLAESKAERDKAQRDLNETKTKRDEAVAQQAAISEILQIVNGSPGDLAPVFDAILEKAHTLCGAEYGGLATYDGEYFRLVAARGYPDHMVEVLRRPFRGNFSHQQLLHGERYVHIEDALALPKMADSAGQVTQEGGFRTVLMVPLRKDGAMLGHISASRQEVSPFSEEQIALLQNFAAQAVIAMENARLLTETREALEQQTATAEVLQVINNSPGDLAPVFDAMLEKATRLCEAPYGQLAIYDGELFRFVAVHGESRYAEQQRRDPTPPSYGVTWLRIVGGAAIVHIADVLEDDGYFRTEPSTRALVDASGMRTVLTVALRKDEALLGVLTVYRQEVRPFSDKQIGLLQNFAAQAVIAIENARLITETREALEQQTATAEVLQVINSSPGDLAPVFDAMLEKAHSLCGIAFGSLQLHEDGKFRAIAVRGVPGPLADMLRLPHEPRPGAPPFRLLAGERIVHIADMADPSQQVFPRSRAAVEHGFRTALYVPLRRRADLFGFITAYRDEVRPFSEKEIALLENFAAQAVIAMENARLLTETREALEQQTATAEVLQVINSSPGDLAPVFEAILEKAHSLCGVAHGGLVLREGETFRAVALHSYSGEFAEQLRQGYRGADNPSLGR
jgi:GAF domain-containing protein